MKRFFAVFLILLLFLCCPACGKQQTDIRPMVRGITFTAELSYYNECCECRVTVQKNGDAVMELLSPESVSGLSFSFSGTRTAVSYQGLSCEYDLSSLPEGIACGRLYQILNAVALSEQTAVSDGGGSYVAGRTESGKYRMLVAGTGLPLSIESPDDVLSVTVKNVSVLDAKA